MQTLGECRCEERNAHSGENDLPVFQEPSAHDGQQLARGVIARTHFPHPNPLPGGEGTVATLSPREKGRG